MAPEHNDFIVLVSLSSAMCRELELELKFQELEASSYVELTEAINSEIAVPATVFNLFLGKIYKRTK